MFRRSPSTPRMTCRPRLEPMEDRVLLSGANFPSASSVGGPDGPIEHVVRTYYLIPSNRQPQPRAIESMRNSVLYAQAWYQDAMERNGFGPKTFAIEVEKDGVTPRIHLVYAPEKDNYYRVDPWGRVNGAAAVAGLPIWGRGQVWIAYFEGHLMKPNGSVLGGIAGGGSFGSGSDGGVAMLGSNGLAMTLPEDLTNDAPYAGTIRETVGPYPMRQDVTHAWFEGRTFSSVSSSARGAALHELGHAFGLPHDLRNDDNYHGNVMGNGLRGFRGWVYPSLYPDDDMHLAQGSALALNFSRYFNAAKTFTDTQRPTLTIHTRGTVDPVNGQLEIYFSATDDRRLGAAFLHLGSDRVAELPLDGTQIDQVFVTAHYTPGQMNTYGITILDTEGNRQNASVTITPTIGSNRAPRPYLKISPSQAYVDQWVYLDAGRSSDPNHPTSSLLVEWDLDGDGTFDTKPTTEKTLWTTFGEAGTRLIGLRVTDPDGAQTLAEPIGIRLYPAGGPGAPSDNQSLATDWVEAWLGSRGRSPFAVPALWR